MKQKIALGSFEVTRFAPVIKRRGCRSSRRVCKTCPPRCPARSVRADAARLKLVGYKVAALRRSWRALAQMPPLFGVAASRV